MLTVMCAGVNLTAHARLTGEYLFDRPANGRRLLADYLVDNGVKFAVADFWDAYITTFHANEEVIVASGDVVFLTEYQWLVAERPADTYWIRHEPCVGGTEAVKGWYVCPPN